MRYGDYFRLALKCGLGRVEARLWAESMMAQKTA